MDFDSQAGQVEERISRELIKGIRLTSWKTQGRQGQAGGEDQTSLSYEDGLYLNCNFSPRPVQLILCVQIWCQERLKGIPKARQMMSEPESEFEPPE